MLRRTLRTCLDCGVPLPRKSGKSARWQCRSCNAIFQAKKINERRNQK
jgi:uncharacterized Zn finger protein (UPF0148 family)